ncbi:hypothetical protein [Sulfitobacter sp.]|uniref:hypothetical protein n=1 Tax=Sulfitobacter sp. TaxID=1903071 RepID=UPI003001CACF
MSIYDDLPDNDQQAFMQLEEAFRNILERETEDQNSNFDYWAAQYMNKTIAAAKALNIDPVNEYAVDSYNTQNFSENYIRFRADVDNIVVQMQILTSRRKKSLSVGLSGEQKTKVLALVEKIRLAIENSTANQDKKDKIIKIISSLAQEISKDRTPLERFGDLARGLAGVSREVEEIGAEPWWKWYKAAMGVVDDAKESELQLPKPEQVKRIEPPRRELPKPKRDLDDEIPF